jgi:hypothetical protein
MSIKRNIQACAAAALLAIAGAADAQAQVTGDFKVTSLGYVNDVATVGGTVNHGAIQSGKSVVVDITYEYSFVAEKTETLPGQTSTLQVFVPGRCVTLGAAASADAACYYQSGPYAGRPKALGGAIWTGTYETQTVTTEPQTITHTFTGASGMTAIVTPTVEKGRLNPKGKITGYNWVSNQSIVPTAELVDPALVPPGYTVVSVTINSVSYTAYLIDARGEVIADTVMAGQLAVPDAAQ